MSWFSDAADWVSEKFDRIGDGLKAVGNAAVSAVNWAGEKIKAAADYGADVVRAIAKDPIPTLLRYAAMTVGASFGIPPYVTSAAITAMQGGDIEDIALSAATSYATTTFLTDTQIGADIKNYTVNQWSGDFTDAMTEQFNLPLDTAMQVAKASNAALTSSLAGGMNAVLTGTSVAEGLSSGFITGLSSSATGSYFDSVNKDQNWGVSPEALNLMKGAASTGLSTALSGKGDPAQAIGNYLAYASLNMAGTEVLNTAKSTYNNLTQKISDLNLTGNKVTQLQDEYKTKLNKSEDLRVAINKDTAEHLSYYDRYYTGFVDRDNALLAKYNTALAEYNSYKNSGNVTAANAAADKVNAIGADITNQRVANQPMLDLLKRQSDTITSNVNEFNAIKADIEEQSARLENIKASLTSL